MIKEHALITLSSGKGECVCDPEILLGSTYGLWDAEYRVAPKGTLLDLNAAWELFFDRRTFMRDLRFDTYVHHQMETINGVTYYNGDVTYTLLDDKGGKTNAVFTIKGNQNLAQSIEWQNGSLVIYYDRTRAESDEDLASGYDLHYIYDNQGNHIIDRETGRPMIYSYVPIPLLDLFDQDEVHKLFPWYADDQHTVRLRQNLDNPNNTTQGHLGDLAITNESEVFIAKQRYQENAGNILISLQSLISQLQTVLGITPTYQTDSSIIDEEGSSIHQRAIGSNISSVLNTTTKESLVAAINEINSNLGNINNLSTTDKTNVVSALNEVLSNLNSSVQSLQQTIGQLQTQISTESGLLEAHKADHNNPHQVTATQLSVIVNDPNDPTNVQLEQQFNVNYNVLTALQQLFDRLNVSEDSAAQLAILFASAEELQQLDQLDEINGNSSPTVVGTLLNVYNLITSYTPISNQDITTIVNTYFTLQ